MKLENIELIPSKFYILKISRTLTAQAALLVNTHQVQAHQNAVCVLLVPFRLVFNPLEGYMTKRLSFVTAPTLSAQKALLNSCVLKG